MEGSRENASKGMRLSSDAIKYIAAVAMLTDHIAWCFAETYSAFGQIMHIIGRIAAPIMCYFISEGYHYTRNVNRYLLRLGIFAVISWFPFVYMDYGQLPFGVSEGQQPFIPYQSVIFTLFLGLCALKTVHNEKILRSERYLIVLILCALSVYGDWRFKAVVWILMFDRYRGDFKKQMAAFAVSSVLIDYILYIVIMKGAVKDNLFQLGTLLAVIPLYFYSGEKGRSGGFFKWFFYVFYPAHMLALGILKYCIL